MKRTKLKAFTLLELLVTLLISSLLVGILYSSLYFIYKRYGELSKRSEGLLEVSSFRRALTHDFKTSAFNLAGASAVACLTDSSRTEYLFEEDYVLRIYEDAVVTQVDTFLLACTPPQFFRDKQEVYNEGELVEALTFEALTGEEKYPFSIQRNYSAAARMRFEEISGKENGRITVR